MRDGWVYELVDRCGWGEGALGYVICDLHMWVGVGVSVSTGRTGLVEGTANTCLYSAPGEGSTGRKYRSYSCLCCATLEK